MPHHKLVQSNHVSNLSYICHILYKITHTSHFQLNLLVSSTQINRSFISPSFVQYLNTKANWSSFNTSVVESNISKYIPASLTSFKIVSRIDSAIQLTITFCDDLDRNVNICFFVDDKKK
uniref:Uncharacterized protein n=1 Tax=Sipha flava TaxID=143950 RepID=A0A2S2Q2R9_9HEMI